MQFSLKCDKYVEGDLERKWASIRPTTEVSAEGKRLFTLDSLVKWASKDDPDSEVLGDLRDIVKIDGDVLDQTKADKARRILDDLKSMTDPEKKKTLWDDRDKIKKIVWAARRLSGNTWELFDSLMSLCQSGSFDQEDLAKMLMTLWNTRLMGPITVKTWCDHPILPEVAPALPQVAPALPPVAAAPVAAWHEEMAMAMHLSEVAAEQAEKASQSLQEQNALVVAIESPEQEDDPHEQGLPVENESSPTKRLKKSSTGSEGEHL